MDYRVSATNPQPPARIVAWIGGLSALALAASPFLSWWIYEFGFSAPADPTATSRFFFAYPGRSHAFGRLLVFFALLCVPLWMQYGRDTARWMQPIVAQLVITLYLACAVAAATLIAFILLTRSGLPGMYADSYIMEP